MKIVLEYGSESENMEAPSGSRVIDVLRGKNISPDTAIAFLGSKPIPMDSVLEDGMSIRVVSVVSGG